MADWGNPFGWTESQWAEVPWTGKFALINPFFWRYLIKNLLKLPWNWNSPRYINCWCCMVLK